MKSLNFPRKIVAVVFRMNDIDVNNCGTGNVFSSNLETFVPAGLSLYGTETAKHSKIKQQVKY